MPELSPLATRLVILAGVGLVVWVIAITLRRYFSAASVPLRFDRQDAGVRTQGAFVVEFTSPYCFDCEVALPVLQAASTSFGTPLAVIDAKERPELANKYDIRHTPTILVVDARDSVRRGWLGPPPIEELEATLRAVRNGRR